MQSGRFSSEELRNRIERWGKKISLEKKNSWPCNLPVSLLDCDGEKLETVFVLHTDPSMENPWGVTHGGVLAAALDWCMGITARTALDQCDAPTVSLQIDYLKPVPINEDLIIRVQVDHAGKMLAHMQAKGYIASSPDCRVSASGHYVMRNRPLDLTVPEEENNASETRKG